MIRRLPSAAPSGADGMVCLAGALGGCGGAQDGCLGRLRGGMSSRPPWLSRGSVVGGLPEMLQKLFVLTVLSLVALFSVGLALRGAACFPFISHIDFLQSR